MALLLCTMTNDEETDNERKGADGVNYAPHANSPSPGCSAKHSSCDIATDPGVDDEGQSRDVTEEQTGSDRGDISNNDFDQQQNHGITNLVNNSTSRVGIEILRGSLNDSTDGVEKHRDADKFDTAKNIGDFTSGRLSSSSDDGAEGVDGGLQGVLLEFIQGRRLIGVANCAVKTVGIGDEENT
jgi:hypothetical protein